ncbi:MAG: DUF4382 domain-containing protein [Candidatus Pacebacteria bacterium]|nr:DUF4382 domain-containing protein [Candidatus Paceibacterota bacterium]
MNKTLLTTLGIIVIVGGLYFALRTPNPANNGNENQEQKVTTKGNVIFSVTDAAVNMSGISEVNMHVSKLAIHNNVDGWVSVSITPQTYELLQLNKDNEDRFLAQIDTPTGTYDQVRLTVDSVSIKTKAGVVKQATLPGNDITINTKLVVGTNTISSVNFDVLADKSLFTATGGGYVFAPVIRTETRSMANVKIETPSNIVTISGGTVDGVNTIGMDVDGTVSVDFEINPADKININANGSIDVTGILK